MPQSSFSWINSQKCAWKFSSRCFLNFQHYYCYYLWCYLCLFQIMCVIHDEFWYDFFIGWEIGMFREILLKCSSFNFLTDVDTPYIGKIYGHHKILNNTSPLRTNKVYLIKLKTFLQSITITINKKLFSIPRVASGTRSVIFLTWILLSAMNLL